MIRAACRGALFLFSLASGRAGKLFVLALLGALMVLLGVLEGLALFIQLLALTMLAGAVAGIVHRLMRPVEAWGVSGIWLQWTAVLFGWGLTVVALTPHGPVSLQETTFIPFGAVVSALGAVFVILFDDRRPGRPRPRQYYLQQIRARMWASARSRAREATGL